MGITCSDNDMIGKHTVFPNLYLHIVLLGIHMNRICKSCMPTNCYLYIVPFHPETTIRSDVTILFKRDFIVITNNVKDRVFYHTIILNNNHIIHFPLLLYEIKHISNHFSTFYATNNGRFFSFEGHSSHPIFYECTQDNTIEQILSLSDKQKTLKQLFIKIKDNTFLFTGSYLSKKINEITIEDSTIKNEKEFEGKYKNQLKFDEISSINKYNLDKNTICLLVGTNNGFLISINYTERQIITIFRAHKEPITLITILHNGYCVSRSLDGTLAIWSLPSFKEIKKYNISLIEHKHIIQIDDGRIVSNSGVNSFSVYNETFTEEIAKNKAKTLWEIINIEDLKRDNTIIIGTKVTAELWTLNQYECIYIFNASYTVNLTHMSLIGNNKFIMGNCHTKIHLFLQREEQSLDDVIKA